MTDSAERSIPRTSNQCSVCGKPATSAVLKDPFGKSDVWEPRCGDHGMRLYGAAMNTSIVTRLQKLQSEGFELSELEKLVAGQGETIERLTRENAELTSAIVKEALAKDRLREALERISTLEIPHGVSKPMPAAAFGEAQSIAREALSVAPSAPETKQKTWPAPPREITLYGTPDGDVGIEEPECYTALNIGGHSQAILVVTQMRDGTKVPPYAQQVIDWMLGRNSKPDSAPKAGAD